MLITNDLKQWIKIGIIYKQLNFAENHKQNFNDSKTASSAI